MSLIRAIAPGDIPDLFDIRIRTWENPNGAAELEALGITPETVLKRLQTDHAGWIAFVDKVPVGFVMGNRTTSELWVIAVLPEFEGQGIGGQLMKRAETWLFEQGCDPLWLTTYLEEDARAVGFYRHLGWKDWKIEVDRFMRKWRPAAD